MVDRSTVLFRNSRSAKGEDPKEIEANNFAAELLMPQELLEKELSKGRIDLDDGESLEKLAKRFGVSVQALMIRLTALRFVSA